MKDWMIRAIKTFVQAFLGVLVPELAALLGGADLGALADWGIWAPLLAAALAAGISAAWNLALERFGTGG